MMKSKILFLIVSSFLSMGCSQIMPYKTTFDCNKKPTGNCGSLTDNIREAYSLAGVSKDEQLKMPTVNYRINQVVLDIKE